jgi:hypothetical protein
MASIQDFSEKGVLADDTVLKGPVTAAPGSIDLEADSTSTRRPGSIWTIVGCVS